MERGAGVVDELCADGGVAGGARRQEAQGAIGTVGQTKTDLSACRLVAIGGAEARAHARRGIGQSKPAGQGGQAQAAGAAGGRDRKGKIKGVGQGIGHPVNRDRIGGVGRGRSGIRQGVEVLGIDGAIGVVSDKRGWRRAADGVAGAGRGRIELHADKALAVGQRTIGPIGRQVDIVDIIENLRLAAEDPTQCQRAIAAGEGEAGVQFVRSGQIGLAVGKYHQELAGVDARPGRERPVGQVEVVSGQIQSCQGDGIGAGIVELDPRRALAGLVGDARQIL